MLRPYRPWVTYGFAELADHFELIDVIGAMAILGYRKPIPPEKIKRLIENRFSADERVDLVTRYASTLIDPEMQWAFLAQAGWVAIKYSEATRAQSLIATLKKQMPTVQMDAVKESTLQRLELAAVKIQDYA